MAGEVRKLASESQSAAREISGLIGAIQTDTNHAVEVVEGGAKLSAPPTAPASLSKHARRWQRSVEDMTARIEQIAAVSQQIAASAQSMEDNISEIAAVAEQSSASTEEVSACTEHTSASAEQISASAQEVSNSAETVNKLMAYEVVGRRSPHACQQQLTLRTATEYVADEAVALAVASWRHLRSRLPSRQADARTLTERGCCFECSVLRPALEGAER